MTQPAYKASQYGYCHCGCGERTRLATNGSNGNTKGEPQRYLFGHRARKRVHWVERACGYKTPCWLWILSTNQKTGYGFITVREGDKHRTYLAHRYQYEQAKGPIPDGMQVDHLCRVRRCVNPEHLEAVTQTENVRRGAKAKLTIVKAREIRALVASGVSRRAVAERYGVTKTAIHFVVNEQTWKDAA